MSSSDDDDTMSFDDGQATSEAINIFPVIPEKSKGVYESCYKNFSEWQASQNRRTISEAVLLDYFKEKAKVQKSSTLWSDYSKLKLMILLNHNVNICTFGALNVFLKQKSADYVAKKSKTFNRHDVDSFLATADDIEYLMVKATLLIAIAGAFRRDELVKLSTKDVIDSGEFMQINIKDSKTNTPKEFVIPESSPGNRHVLNIIRRYIGLRNPNTSHDRFFVGYRNGKCTVQPVGVNTFGAMPKRIAAFLNLKDVELYTGHCFRRSSAPVLEEYGSEFSVFKRHGADGLRRSIPYYKQQSDSKFEGSSSGTDLQLKIEPNPTDETGTYENCDYQAHDDQQQQDDHEDEEEQVGEEDAQGQEEVEPEPKPQIYNIKYMVPSSLIIREHSSEQRRNEPPVHSFQHPMEQRREPPPLSFPQSSNAGNHPIIISQQQTDESDHQMQDVSDEILPDKANPESLSTQAKIDRLRLKEMENRVTESRLRCEVQQMIMNKTEEEFRHLQEMNRLRIQEAKIRLKLLEQQSCAGGTGGVESMSSL